MDIAEQLSKSAHTFRKPILQLPSIGIEDAIKHMTPRPGVRYKETEGYISSNVQLRPYNGESNGKSTIGLKERSLETFLGSAVELFDPNTLRQTIYGQLITHSDEVKDPDMNKAILFKIMKDVLEKLNTSLFSAKRNASGDTTAELFNGFDEIVKAEMTAGKISTVLGNYKELEAINSTNAVDILKALYRSSSDDLKRQKTKLFVPFDVKEAYDDDYQQTVGSVPYNNQFNQTFLEGSNGLCEIVPLVAKAGSTQIHLTTKENMLYGYGNGVENETIEVRRGDNPFKLQFVLAMFFGVDFQFIEKQKLMVGEIKTA